MFKLGKKLRALSFVNAARREPRPGSGQLGPLPLATIGAMTALVALPVAERAGASGYMNGSTAARVLVVLTTASLAVAVGQAAIQARTSFRARMWLAFGAGGAGALAMWISYVGAMAVRGARLDLDVSTQLGGCFALGGSLGFVLGTGFAPVVMVARRVVAGPSHDGQDRVVFACAVSVGAAAVARALLRDNAFDLAARLSLAVGAVAFVVSAVRIIRRVRLVARARLGLVPGFHVVPALGCEEDQALVPLVRFGRPPLGVLAATGVSAPYRGARGIFKLGLAPLPDEPFDRPLVALVRAVIAEVATTFATLVAGCCAMILCGPLVCLVCLSASAIPFG